MTLPITEIQLFQFLKEKMGEKEAEALVTFVDTRIKETVRETNEQNLKVLASKEDIVNTNLKISDLRTELKEDIANLRTEIAVSRAEMIKWMFIFWIGQLAAFIAIAKFFFGK